MSERKAAYSVRTAVTPVRWPLHAVLDLPPLPANKRLIPFIAGRHAALRRAPEIAAWEAAWVFRLWAAGWPSLPKDTPVVLIQEAHYTRTRAQQMPDVDAYVKCVQDLIALTIGRDGWNDRSVWLTPLSKVIEDGPGSIEVWVAPYQADLPGRVRALVLSGEES